jgi:hypothetical protein
MASRSQRLGLVTSLNCSAVDDGIQSPQARSTPCHLLNRAGSGIVVSYYLHLEGTAARRANNDARAVLAATWGTAMRTIIMLR